MAKRSTEVPRERETRQALARTHRKKAATQEKYRTAKRNLSAVIKNKCEVFLNYLRLEDPDAVAELEGSVPLIFILNPAVKRAQPGSESTAFCILELHLLVVR